MTSLISQKVTNRARRDMAFIFRQLLRFARMTTSERKSHYDRNPMDVFRQLPHPDGRGHIPVGDLGWARMGALADLALDLDRPLALRINRELARSVVSASFVRLVLQEERQIDQETAALLLEDALHTLRRSLVVTEHHIPCVLFPDGEAERFKVGPVTFTRRRRFFNEQRSALRKSVEAGTSAHVDLVSAAVEKGFPCERAYTGDESRRLIRRLHAGAIATYRRYPWIASVHVTDCEEEFSRQRAAEAVEMALHVVRVLLGSEPTRKLRVAWAKIDALQTAHLFADAGGVIHASVGRSAMEPVGTKNWYEALIQNNYYLEVLGSALSPIVNPIDIHHLHQRLLDAIRWFGDAATDSNPSSSIAKYVSAIERLFFGTFQRDRTKHFARRISRVLTYFECDDDVGEYEQVLNVYRMRSELLHGEISPADTSVHKVAHRAAQLSRLCILCAAQLYPNLIRVFGSITPSTLEKAMERTTTEGLSWLEDAKNGEG